MEKKYYKYKLENLLVISKIITIHYFEFDKNFVSHTESHDFWELVYADKGDLICSIEDKETILKEGEVIFHKPGVTHAHRADGRRAPNVFIISFECKNEAMRFFEDRLMQVDKGFLRFIFAIIDESKRTFDLPYSDPALKKMKLLENPTLGGQQLIKNYLELLLINLMRNETEKEDAEVFFLPQEKVGEQVAEQVIRYLKLHLYERVTIADICEALSYNKSYIFQQFKKATNCSVMAYFTRLKIERAKRMLRETSLSVTEISDRLSFDTPNYFSKTFKRITGYTPLQYKKFHRH